MTFNDAEAAACRHLVGWALAEDLGPLATSGADVTSDILFSSRSDGTVAFIARQPGVLAGLPAIGMVFTAVVPQLTFQPLLEDGAALEPGTRIGVVSGPLCYLFTAERTALNFVQHLSGIATLTRRYVDAVKGFPCRILDTRKTIPGWRLLEKYAVRCGGGYNHRLGLYDGILIKDNHLAALAKPWTISQIIEFVRVEAKASRLPLEIEVDTLEQLDEALIGRPDIILLDNMSLEQLREAVRRRNAVAPAVLLEASGGVTLDTVRAIAETGVDRISVGALTHSAPALDIALDYL
jgi:nicotinate-nucleotide pyrophosphorylase (carboxylating)